MPIVRAQVIIPYFPLTPDAVSTNTLHFSCDDPLSTASLDELEARIPLAYAEWGGRYSQVVASTARCKVFNLDESEPRVPVREFQWTLPSHANQGLPEELAACLSFQAPPLSGVNQARRRGRVYLGPWGTSNSNVGSGSTFSSVSTDLINDMLDGATILGRTTANVFWGVWSPTAGTFAVISEAWVDNAWDIQRSRGPAPSGRNTRAIP